MRAELAAREGRPAAKSRSTNRDDDEPQKPVAELPALDTLVARLPEDVRATLDELFRLRFQAVRQVPRKALVPPNAKASA